MNDKELKIYDILYDLYIDDTDCTQCGHYTGFCLLEKQCEYHEHFVADEVVKEFLTKKSKGNTRIIRTFAIITNL